MTENMKILQLIKIYNFPIQKLHVFLEPHGGLPSSRNLPPLGEITRPFKNVAFLQTQPLAKLRLKQFSRSGSTCFWASRIRIHLSEVWIRILLSSSKNSKKNLDSNCFVTSFGLLSLKNEVYVPSNSNKLKFFFFKLVFCWCLEGQ
jgi:hypothetical protein